MHTRGEITEVLKESLRTVVEGMQDKALTDETSMDAFGVDSLELVEVVSRTMKKLNVKVARTEVSRINNIGELVTLFEKASTTAKG
jgi:acyl carrier protein